MPITLTQKVWQITSYLQLGGLINWFYVVITFFSQRLNKCSPKLRDWRRLLPPPGYTSGNSHWWLCGFDPFVAIGNPQTTYAGHEHKFGMVSEICNRQKNA